MMITLTKAQLLLLNKIIAAKLTANEMEQLTQKVAAVTSSHNNQK